MDFTPADITNQLQNTTFLTNVFMTSFLAALSVEGIKTIIGFDQYQYQLILNDAMTSGVFS